MFNWLVLLVAECYLLFYCIKKYYQAFFLQFMVRMGIGMRSNILVNEGTLLLKSLHQWGKNTAANVPPFLSPFWPLL